MALSHFLMLAVFYSYILRNISIISVFKNKTNFYNLYKIKLYKTSKCLKCFICLLWSDFFKHFHKSFSENPWKCFPWNNNRSIVFLRCLWMPICKEVSSKVWLIHAEQMSLYNFFILRKERDYSTDVFLWNFWNF